MNSEQNCTEKVKIIVKYTKWSTNGTKSNKSHKYMWSVLQKISWCGSKNQPPVNDAQIPCRRISRVWEPIFNSQLHTIYFCLFYCLIKINCKIGQNTIQICRKIYNWFLFITVSFFYNFNNKNYKITTFVVPVERK